MTTWLQKPIIPIGLAAALAVSVAGFGFTLGKLFNRFEQHDREISKVAETATYNATLHIKSAEDRVTLRIMARDIEEIKTNMVRRPTSGYDAPKAPQPKVNQ